MMAQEKNKIRQFEEEGVLLGGDAEKKDRDSKSANVEQKSETSTVWVWVWYG